ncbi:MAG: cytochrome C peroxidase [Gemmatimonadota bacterium]|nr:cytochrome C peroxidase [Gemmatimonadota bacterium]
MKRYPVWAALSLVLLGCGEDVFEPPVEPQPTLDAQLRQNIAAWGVMPIGELSPQPPAQVELGRALFFDKILSGNRDVACATCHQPGEALADGRSLAVGTGASGSGLDRTPGPDRSFVPRSAPSLLNVGLSSGYLLWDGRLASFGPGQVISEDLPLPPGLSSGLVAQAFLPVLDRGEMRGEPGDTDVHGQPNELALLDDEEPDRIWAAVVDRLRTVPEYVDLFGSAFPEVPTNQLRYEHVARALAAFEREAFSRSRSPFDRYLDRDDAALTTVEKRGALLFFREAGCVSCHNGPMLGGQGFANVGMPQVGPGEGPEPPLDLGRGALPQNDFYRFAFRIPPLRNVELTAPYTHAGAYPTLEAVVDHYNDVPAAMRNYDVSQLEPSLRTQHHGESQTLAAVFETLDGRFRGPLGLEEGEKAELVAFLKSLTDPAARNLASVIPSRVPSGLPVGN